MTDPLRLAASRWPDAPAVTDTTSSRSWARLCDDARALADAIGTAPGTSVALLADDRAATVVAIHAVRLAGGILVPLHRRLSPAELLDQVTRTGTAVVLHDRTHTTSATTVAARAGGLRTVDVDARDRPSRSPEDPPVRPGPTATGAIVHTSGTTARPRGVALSADALFASATAWNLFLDSGPTDHWLSTLPLSHVAGLGMALRPVLSGARLSVHASFEPDAVRAALADDGVTLLSLVPTQLARLLDSGPVRSGTLRAVLLGGAPVPGSLVARALDAGLPVVTTYGLTEAGSGVTALLASEAPLAPGSVGRPLPGMRLRVVGPGDVDAATDVTGTILVAGPSLATAYLDDPSATAATFVDGWLRTRDVGRLDGDGRLWVVDRVDDIIITGGENVSPAEVEAVLATHPAIADVAVVGRPDPDWGAVPVAAIVRRPGRPAPSVETLRDFARPALAGYKLPVEAHVIRAVPRTASGKVIRRDVVTLLADAGLARVPRSADVSRPDGAVVHVEMEGSGPVVLLLHATLSNARELRGLATRLSDHGRVLSVDRRTAGASRMPADDPGGAVDVGTHVDDLVAVLDTLLPGERVLVVGHSFGGCVALEMAARHPDRVVGAWVFEPPYLPVLRPDAAPDLTALGDRIAAIARDRGSDAAALAFLDAVHGTGTAGRLSPTVRERLVAEGRAAVADAALAGLEPDGLGRIEGPVVLGSGGRGRGPYRAIAEALSDRLPTLTLERFADLGHGGPVTHPERVVPSIIALAHRLGHIDAKGQPEGSP